MEGKIKAATVVGRMRLVRLDILAHLPTMPAGGLAQKLNDFNGPSAIAVICRSVLRHVLPDPVRGRSAMVTVRPKRQTV